MVGKRERGKGLLAVAFSAYLAEASLGCTLSFVFSPPGYYGHSIQASNSLFFDVVNTQHPFVAPRGNRNERDAFQRFPHELRRHWRVDLLIQGSKELTTNVMRIQYRVQLTLSASDSDMLVWRPS